MKILEQILFQIGFERFYDFKTSWPMYQLSNSGTVRCVYSPSIDKKMSFIAISGIVGLIDIDYAKYTNLEYVSVDLLGRHLLSIFSEIGFEWYIHPEKSLITERVQAIKQFMKGLPIRREEIAELYNNGELSERKLILDYQNISKYVLFCQK